MNGGTSESLGSFVLLLEHVGLPLTFQPLLDPGLAVQVQEEGTWEVYKTLLHFLTSTRSEESQLARDFSCYSIQLGPRSVESGVDSRLWDWKADLGIRFDPIGDGECL